MGQPNRFLAITAVRRSEPGEAKHPSTQRKRNRDIIPLVAASEKGRA